MEYTIYIQRLATESISVSANSVRAAMDMVAEKVGGDLENVIRMAGVDEGGKISDRLLPDLNWYVITPTERGLDNQVQEISKQLHLQIAKGFAVLRKISEFHTTEDIAFEQEVSEMEAYLSRDFEDEYGVLMEVIRKARAALDLPDCNLVPGE
ncbi:hypothetical protein HPDFL43_16381 [Hoeflea phototrophica DFL-43]|uniref:Uncharacterized protein n=1 Tax=Hoeflea phototrophica (strain DSM 17068 / NCIMB 14078 / DFL-43) TaxID=411684 RepID=A9D7F9_HOEPD|nr:hypothetical protein [Hoeflea phototrophica]EDQ33070.2 hypothetical protein HPDFL43_16381 [Hoeflea phototrophica DFL-43]